MWTWYPPIGVYIAILALVGVLVPLFRDLTRIGRWEKAAWTAIMFLLVILEIKSIYQERNAHDKEQSDARSEQLSRFEQISDGLKNALQQSDQQFKATMQGIKSTLTSSERTLKNSQPRAVLETKLIDVPTPMVPTVQTRLTFNVHYTNYGNDVARDSRNGALIFIRKKDDIAAQKELAAIFDKFWRENTHPVVVTVNPNEPRLFSFTSDSFTESEIKGIGDHSMTFYILIRYTWRDGTGRWVGDQCFSMQDPTQASQMGHTCKFHENHRYRAK
jgi:hypothetical protein